MKRYSIILADPPWKYAARIPHKERADGTKKPRFGEGAEGHYPTMEDKEILEMSSQIGAIASDNSVLCLWVTGPRLPFGIQVLQAWGYRYATIGWVWVKITLNAEQIFQRLVDGWNLLRSKPTWHEFLDFLTDTGPGYYTASNVEIVLIGVKGRMPPIKRMRRQIIFERRREHSRKPDQIRDRIVEVFGDLPRAELFCRHPAPGWDAFGNEVDGRDIREALETG